MRIVGLSILLAVYFLFFQETALCQGSIVVNGGFEQQFTGWSMDDPSVIASTDPIDGPSYAVVARYLWQDLQTVPGQLYAIRFAVSGDVNNPLGATAIVHFNPTGRYQVAYWNPPRDPSFPTWDFHYFEAQAVGEITTLFIENQYEARRPLRIDAISVVPIPEPNTCGLFLLATLIFKSTPRFMKFLRVSSPTR